MGRKHKRNPDFVFPKKLRLNLNKNTLCLEDKYTDEEVKSAFLEIFNSQRLNQSDNLIKSLIDKEGNLIINCLPAQKLWAIGVLLYYINWKDYFKLTTHHIIPSSRFVNNEEFPEDPNDPDNLLEIPYLIHWNFHVLFGNRKPDEIMDFLRKKQKKKFLGKKNKLLAWLIIFGAEIEFNDEPAIRYIIKTDWTKK